MKLKFKVVFIILMVFILQNISLAADIGEHIEGQAVFFADSLEEAQSIADSYNAELFKFENGVGVLEGISDDEFNEAEEQGLMKSRQAVPKIFPNYIFHTSKDRFTTQALTTNWHHTVMNTADAWQVTKGDYINSSEEIIVAVIDSGIDATHEDLEDNIIDMQDFYSADDGGSENDGVTDTATHGTHVAGIIAAMTNEVGATGVAPNVKLMILKALDTDVPGGEASGTLFDVARAILYAGKLEGESGRAGEKADIINLSLSAEDIESPAFEAIFDAANAAGIMVVCAAGNSNTSTANYPAYYDSTISVAASSLDAEGENILANFSNFGDWVDVAAPGVQIYSTIPGDSYGNMSGTSMATPIISGICALAKAVNPNIDTKEEILPYLQSETLSTASKTVESTEYI